jgi:Domain of unknown function (DUF4169)
MNLCVDLKRRGLMGEVINLRLARKAKARLAKESQAAENRVKFGEPTALRKARDAEKARQRAVLDSGIITLPKDQN